jgi:hypothetical protein
MTSPSTYWVVGRKTGYGMTYYKSGTDPVSNIMTESAHEACVFNTQRDAYRKISDSTLAGCFPIELYDAIKEKPESRNLQRAADWVNKYYDGQTIGSFKERLAELMDAVEVESHIRLTDEEAHRLAVTWVDKWVARPGWAGPALMVTEIQKLILSLNIPCKPETVVVEHNRPPHSVQLTEFQFTTKASPAGRRHFVSDTKCRGCSYAPLFRPVLCKVCEIGLIHGQHDTGNVWNGVCDGCWSEYTRLDHGPWTPLNATNSHSTPALPSTQEVEDEVKRGLHAFDIARSKVIDPAKI